MKKTLLFLAAMLCGCFALKAQQNYDFTDNSTGQTIYYRITDAEQHTVSIVAPHSDISLPWEGFEKPTGEISLPQSVEYNNTSYTVTGIGTYAFLSCNGLTGQLIIPDGVTSIGVSAFYGCSGFTGSLTIPNSVKIIEQEAFMLAIAYYLTHNGLSYVDNGANQVDMDSRHSVGNECRFEVYNISTAWA